MRPSMAHPLPQSSPAILTNMRGPSLSMSHPEQGMNQVSAAMKNVNAHWTSESFQWCAAIIGLTNRVQAYCRLAIMIIATTAAANRNHRFTCYLLIAFQIRIVLQVL